MRPTIGCTTILLVSCAGCCCGRIPTFGLWPDVDEAAIRDAVRADAFVVDHVCTTEQRCHAVRDAEIAVLPVGWNPFTGTVTTVVAVEATCTPSDDPVEQAAPLLCAGTLGVVGAASGGALIFGGLTEDWMFFTTSGVRPRTLPSEYGGGGDFDWD